jgi:hypothetical protein
MDDRTRWLIPALRRTYVIVRSWRNSEGSLSPPAVSYGLRKLVLAKEVDTY